MKIFTFSLVLIFIFLSDLKSQVHEDWVQRYNGPGNADDEATALIIDGSGNVCVTGKSYVSGTGYDFATVVYNSSGALQWVRRYNGPGNDEDAAFSIAADAQGNVYVTGYSTGTGTDYDIATIKYNSTGVQQWVQRYNGASNSEDLSRSVAIDGSGNVYITGISYGSGTSFDIITIKYNTSGVQQWVQRFNGPGNTDDYAFSIACDNSGNVYVTGSVRNGLAISTDDFITIKYNTAGVQQWVRTYDGPGSGQDNALAVQVISATSSVYVTGQSVGNGTADDYATIKYSTSGIQQWVQRYTSTGALSEDATSLAVDPSGSYIFVTGFTSANGTNWDFATVKYNSSGVQQWVKTYNGPGNGNDVAYSIAADGSGNCYVLGYTVTSTYGLDYATIKYNSAGVQQWVQMYHSADGGSDPASIGVDGSGNVFVTGQSKGSGSANDYCTIKYSQQIGIRKISSEIPDKYNLSQNYPNPFNPSTKIKFQIPGFPLMKGVRGMNVLLTVYDILGREVATLVNEQLKPGTYEAEFDGTNYSSGIYIYKLVTDASSSPGTGFSESKKMLMLK